MTRHRPVLLEIGLILASIRTFFALGFAVFVTLVSSGILAVSVPALAISEEPSGALVALGAGAMAGVALLIYFGIQLFKLFVYWRSWHLNRTWLFVLIGVTLFAFFMDMLSMGGTKILCCCIPLTVIIDALVIIGAIQALASDNSDS